MSAAFTLSLDCEGLWGMADHLHSPELGLITQEGLRETYQFVHDTLLSCELRCTAAFVTAFAAGPDRLMMHDKAWSELQRINPRWFDGIVAALKSGRTSGWDGQWCFELMRTAGHEMAWHGTTHQDLSDEMTSEAFELEMQLTQALHTEMHHSPTSIVFPRNQVGQLSRLHLHGFDAYRDCLQEGGRAGRLLSKLAEFSPVAPHPDLFPRMAGAWRVVAPGRFLHWPCGHRALVPVSLTVSRWRSMLETAVREGGVVHMWFHPHNLLTAPAMRRTFREILSLVATHVRAGSMRNLTMAELSQFGAC